MTAIRHWDVKLGRKKPDATARARMAELPNLVSYVKLLHAPALARYWSTSDGTPYGARRSVSMFANDRLGDCTVAALAHQDQLAATEIGETSPLQTADVVALYKQSGYDPEDPSSDQGWHNLSAAHAALKAGWIDAMVRFDCTNRTLLEIVVNELGFAYVGIDLPRSAQAQMGKVWDVAPGKEGDEHEPGSWGGHATGVVDVDADGVVIPTWGGYQRASWPFVARYFDASDGIATLNRFWRKRPVAPSGIRVDDIIAEMTRIKSLAWL